jgi:hypothetical protein
MPKAVKTVRVSWPSNNQEQETGSKLSLHLNLAPFWTMNPSELSVLFDLGDPFASLIGASAERKCVREDITV